MIKSKLTRGREININVEVAKFLSEITQTFADDISLNLEKSRIVTKNQGGSYGSPAPLKENYRRYKQRNYGYDNIFHGKTKRLLNSIKTRKIHELKHRIYSDVDYSEYVNDGTNRMKPRRFFGLSQNIISEAEKKFNGLKIG